MGDKNSNFNEVLYINSSNVNYIVNQMEERQLVYMTNGNLLIAKENILNFLTKICTDKLFVKVKMRENELDAYINLNNIESALKCHDGSIILKFLSGKNIVVLSAETVIEKLTKMNIVK